LILPVFQDAGNGEEEGEGNYDEFRFSPGGRKTHREGKEGGGPFQSCFPAKKGRKKKARSFNISILFGRRTEGNQRKKGRTTLIHRSRARSKEGGGRKKKRGEVAENFQNSNVACASLSLAGPREGKRRNMPALLLKIIRTQQVAKKRVETNLSLSAVHYGPPALEKGNEKKAQEKRGKGRNCRGESLGRRHSQLPRRKGGEREKKRSSRKIRDESARRHDVDGSRHEKKDDASGFARNRSRGPSGKRKEGVKRLSLYFPSFRPHGRVG